MFNLINSKARKIPGFAVFNHYLTDKAICNYFKPVKGITILLNFIQYLSCMTQPESFSKS